MEDRRDNRRILRSILAEDDQDAKGAKDDKGEAAGGDVPFNVVAFTVQYLALNVHLMNFPSPKKENQSAILGSYCCFKKGE